MWSKRLNLARYKWYFMCANIRFKLMVINNFFFCRFVPHRYLERKHHPSVLTYGWYDGTQCLPKDSFYYVSTLFHVQGNLISICDLLFIVTAAFHMRYCKELQRGRRWLRIKFMLKCCWCSCQLTKNASLNTKKIYAK